MWDERFPFVHYIDVRNTLSTALPDEYKNWWDNELHPTESGFEKVTEKFAAVLQGVPYNPFAFGTANY